MTTREGADIAAQRRAVWRRAVILSLLTIGLAVLATSDAVHAALIGVLAELDTIISTHPVLGGVLFVVYAAVSAMFAFLSIALLLPVAVYTWGEPLSILLLWTGWTLGGALTYGIGRFLGRRVVRWLTADALLRKLEGKLGPDTPFTLVLLFQFALPSEIPGYVLGLVRYSFPKYLLALGLVELLYTVAMVYLGAGFLAGSAGIVLATGAAAVLFSVVAFVLLRRRMAATSRRD